MIDAATRALLEFAIKFIERDNDLTKRTHTNPRTGEIEPGSVRREVAAATAWLEKARRALKASEPEKVSMDLIAAPHGDDDGGDPALAVSILEQDAKVWMRFSKASTWVSFEAQAAADAASALVKHARIAGRKTGRVVEVKL